MSKFKIGQNGVLSGASPPQGGAPVVRSSVYSLPAGEPVANSSNLRISSEIWGIAGPYRSASSWL